MVPILSISGYGGLSVLSLRVIETASYDLFRAAGVERQENVNIHRLRGVEFTACDLRLYGLTDRRTQRFTNYQKDLVP